MRRKRAFPTGTVLLVCVPVVYLLIFGVFLLRKGDSDWDQFFAFHRIQLWNWQMQGPEKHWNPLMRGGMSLAGDPQVPVLTPSMLLAHIVPVAAALKLSCLLFLALGGLGAYLLARRLGLDAATAALAGALFAGNGFILARFSRGHLGFLGTLCLPLWLWASRVVADESSLRLARRALRAGLFVLAGGAIFAISTDGAPIVLLLTLTWVGMDALVLGFQKRTLLPGLVFAGAVLVGFLLDAIYTFPMVANQFVFPRLQPAVFVNPLLFLWFSVMPIRGRLLPAPFNGHELQVYIGPVVAFLLFRYRREIARAIPRGDRIRLVAVSAAALVIGTGSWRSLGRWAPPGPFDLLHLLPGYRSIGVPSRFWGFLALPLALAAAVAIRGFERHRASRGSRIRMAAGLLLFTVGFQAGTLIQPFLTEKGRFAPPPVRAPERVEVIEQVLYPGIEGQGAVFRPDRGVIHAYNMHDYVRGDIRPGTDLLRSSRDGGSPLPGVRARWNGWNRIEIAVPPHFQPATLVLNQNFHPSWKATRGAIAHTAIGNLALRLPPSSDLQPVALIFHDPWSALGAWVSLFTAAGAAAAAAILVGVQRRLAAKARESSDTGEAIGTTAPTGRK